MAHAGEVGRGAALRQAPALRAVAHQHQARTRLVLTHGLEGGNHGAQVLLGCQAAHAHRHAGAGVGTPAGAQGRTAVRRAEALRIHAARDHAQAPQTGRGQLALQACCGHHGAGGAVVEMAQVSHDRRMQPAHAVVAAVGVEVGAEVADHRHAQLAGGAQRRPAQRAFGDDVHDIGPLRCPALDQLTPRRQAHLQRRVARYRQAAQQHLGETRFVARDLGGGLTRPHQLQVVAPRLQAFDHAGQRGGNAVDLGRVGLGDQGHAPGASGRQGGFQQGRLHAAKPSAAWWRSRATVR